MIFHHLFNLQLLQDQFEKRFQQFNIIEPMIIFFINTFTCQMLRLANLPKLLINVIEIATYIAKFGQVRTEELELEILDL